MIADESVAEFISLAGASDEEVGQFRVRNCTDMQARNINQSYSEKDLNIDSCKKIRQEATWRWLEGTCNRHPYLLERVVHKCEPVSLGAFCFRTGLGLVL